MLEKINRKEKLYVIKNGQGYSCLGFDYCDDLQNKIEKELKGRLVFSPKRRKGTKVHYARYLEICDKCRELNKNTGWRSESGLTKELIGLACRARSPLPLGRG